MGSGAGKNRRVATTAERKASSTRSSQPYGAYSDPGPWEQFLLSNDLGPERISVYYDVPMTEGQVPEYSEIERVATEMLADLVDVGALYLSGSADVSELGFAVQQELRDGLPIGIKLVLVGARGDVVATNQPQHYLDATTSFAEKDGLRFAHCIAGAVVAYYSDDADH